MCSCWFNRYFKVLEFEMKSFDIDFINFNVIFFNYIFLWEICKINVRFWMLFCVERNIFVYYILFIIGCNSVYMRLSYLYLLWIINLKYLVVDFFFFNF